MDHVPPTTTGSGLEAMRARRADLRDGVTAVESALAAPARDGVPDWADRVCMALLRLSTELTGHVTATEGPGGLHETVLASTPRLAHAVHRLNRDHAHLRRGIDDLLARAEVGTAVDDVQAVRRGGRVLLARVGRHRQRSADLLFEAYETDIGGEA